MNTKLNNLEINPEYSDLFSFSNNEDKIEHKAQMISYKILSEVERVCENKKIKKKDLADRVGTSKSYISQLFRGSKHVNTQIMARLEAALDISFEIGIKLNEESNDEFLGNQLVQKLNTHRIVTKECVMHLYRSYNNCKTDEIVSKMVSENVSSQIAV